MLWLDRVAFCEQPACMLSKKRLLSDLKPPEVRSNTCTWKIFQGEHVEVAISPFAQWRRGGDAYRMWLALFNFCICYRKIGKDRDKPIFPLPFTW